MTTQTTEPTPEYILKVRGVTKDIKGYEEEDTSALLAFSCWRHDTPFPKAHFEGDEVKFSDEDQETLADYISLLEEFNKSLDQDGDPKFAEHAMHYHGSFSHDHEGGNESHTHEGRSGSYSKTAPSSSNNSEGNMFSEAVLTSLGLSKDATETQVVEAIGALKGASFSETEKKHFEEMQHDYAVSKYMEETTKLTSIPGNPKERAEKLVTISEKTSPEIADDMLRDWKSFQEQAEKAGVTKTLLQSKFSDSGEEAVTGAAESETSKFAEENKVSYQVAIARLATGTTEQRALFQKLRAEQAEKEAN